MYFEKAKIEIYLFGEDIITTSTILKDGEDNTDDNYGNLVFE